MNVLHRFAGQARTSKLVMTVLAAAAMALCAAPVASATTPVVVPAGGDFEQTPLLYSTQTACGLLCSVAASRQAEGPNHYLHTEYKSVLGVIGTNTGTATITSPQFTWTKATPSAVTFAIERRSSLGELLGIDSGVTFTVALADDTSATSTTLAGEELGSSQPTFTPVSVAVPTTDIADGHTYHLVLTESFHTLVGAITKATIDLDNAALAITPATTTASIGSTSLGTPAEHSISAFATVDPHDEAATYGLQYGTTVSYGSETALGNIPAGEEGLQQVTSSLSGLAPATTYHARFVVTDASGTTFGPDMVFTTASTSLPTVGTASAGEITGSGAIVADTVNPGQNATSVEVKYGLTTAYGTTTTAQHLPAGSGATSVQIPLSGLAASTTYHARVVATNADGTAESQDLTFATTAGGGGTGAPAIGPTSASGIGERAASLTTSADPHGEAATYAVEYGLSTGYGSATPALPIAAGSSGPQAESVPIAGLAPATTYHARYVVASGAGTSHSLDVVFTTAPIAPPSIGTAAVNAITSTGANVSTTVNPAQNMTSVEVKFGLTTAYGQTSATQDLSAGAGSTAMQIPLAGLSANTTYHARVSAMNADGTTESQDLTFTTPSGGTEGASGGTEPPTVTATSADGESEHSATLHALVNPHGQEASYEVQYGTSSGYGSASSAQILPLGTSVASPVSVPLAGLQPGTTYHARFRVISSAGTTTGGDVAFSTRGSSGSTGANGGEGGGNSSSSNASAAVASSTGTTPAAGIVPSCLRVQAKRRGPAARLLSVPTLEQISAAHPLRVTLARAAGRLTKLRYSIGGAPYVSTTSRLVKVAPAQLKGTSSTAIRFVLSAAHRKARTLRMVLSATPCGVVLEVRRVGSQLEVNVSRLTRSHGVLLSLPRTVGAPSRLTLVTTTKNHAFRLRSGIRGITLAPKSSSPVLRRSTSGLSVTRLSSQVTGLIVRFPSQQAVTGAIKARITSAGGSVQALTASVK
jgi:hypothetical protein